MDLPPERACGRRAPGQQRAHRPPRRPDQHARKVELRPRFPSEPCVRCQGIAELPRSSQYPFLRSDPHTPHMRNALTIVAVALWGLTVTAVYAEGSQTTVATSNEQAAKAWSGATFTAPGGWARSGKAEF